MNETTALSSGLYIRGLIGQKKIARSFFETLHPILNHLNMERTLSPWKLGVLRYLSEHWGARPPRNLLWLDRSALRACRSLRVSSNGCSGGRAVLTTWIVAGSGLN